MYQEQRLESILQALEERESLSVNDMVDVLGVSKDTIRRDFDHLSRQGLAQRTHGGLLPLQKRIIPGFQERRRELTKEKEAMADLALGLIQEQDLIFLDVSTLLMQVAKKLDKRVTIYSHSLDNALMLSGTENLDFHLLGGKFYPKNRFYYTANQAQILEKVQFDIAFFGAASLSHGKVSFEDEEDVIVKELAMAAARKTVLVAECDKYHTHSKYILAQLQDFDYWITDQAPDPALVKQLEGKVKILYHGKD